MSGQQFTFPPPPPPPPASAQSYPAFNQARGGQNGFGGRGNRDNRGNRGYGRGNRGGGSKGFGQRGQLQPNAGYGGFSGGSNQPPLPLNSGFSSQANSQGRSGYPLPSYPPVQLPQYPTNLGQEYGYAQRPGQESGPPHVNHAPQRFGGKQQHGSYGHASQVHFNQPLSTTNQNTTAPPLKPGTSSGQPILMGPPIRWGFDQQQSNNQTQQFSPPAAPIGTITYQNGLMSGGGSPYNHGHSASDGSMSSRHNSSSPFPSHRGRGMKRGYGDTFGRPRNQNQRPQAAPAVPSFGGPLSLPEKPPIPQERLAKRGKKKRKHNQLGLTPKTEDHESSEEEEDDVDEEARLAATIVGSSKGQQWLQFEYKGRTSTLQSSSEIAAWIEERRKRYPTKSRAEARIAEMTERKRQHEDAQRAANQARKEAQEKKHSEAKERHKPKSLVENHTKKAKEDSEDAAARAKRKVEKLRRQLEKEEKRAAKAEAKVSRKRLDVEAETHSDSVANQFDGNNKRKRSDSDASENTMVGETPGMEFEQPVLATSAVQDFSKPSGSFGEDVSLDAAPIPLPEKPQETTNLGPDPLTPMSQPPILDDQTDSSPSNLDLDHPVSGMHQSHDPVQQITDRPAVRDDIAPQKSSISTSGSSSDISSTDSEDLTSSSGSSSSNADSDDDAPDQVSSKRNGLERVAPPKRVKKTGICREFLKSGRCRRGDNCHWRHELPERGSRGAQVRDKVKTEEKKERVSLYQRLVEQEKEKEDHDVINAIISLGEKGLLDPEEPTNCLER